jgi:hypothetical protein
VKKVVGFLCIANVFMWLWWQGHLAPLMEVPGSGEREPLRTSRQLRVDSIAVVPSAVSLPASAAIKPR